MHFSVFPAPSHSRVVSATPKIMQSQSTKPSQPLPIKFGTSQKPPNVPPQQQPSRRRPSRAMAILAACAALVAGDCSSGEIPHAKQDPVTLTSVLQSTGTTNTNRPYQDIPTGDGDDGTDPSSAQGQDNNGDDTSTAPSSAAPVSSAPTEQSAGIFKTDGSKILSPNGKQFNVKGINIANYQINIDDPNNPDPATVEQAVSNIVDKWNFNTVRYASYILKQQKSGDGSDYSPPSEAVIDKLTAKGVVVILNPHDAGGGYYEGADIEVVKNFYREMATKYKNNPYVWFDLFNEPGGRKGLDDADQWINLSKQLIQVIRDEAGNQNPILIEEHIWGEGGEQAGEDGASPEQSVILSHANKLREFNGKQYDNLIASPHTYENYQGQAERLKKYITKVNAMGFPVVIGEYGTFGATMTTAFRDVFKAAAETNPRLIVWTYEDGDPNDLTKKGQGGIPETEYGPDGIPTNLTELGQMVWDNIHHS